MTFDYTNWAPLSIAEMAREMRDVPVPWWIAGGWAIDLFVGETTRRHGDTDVLVLCRDQLTVQAAMSARWQLYQATYPGLKSWLPGETLPTRDHDVWVRRDDESPWAFQFMLLDDDGDEWVYKRQQAIRGSIADLGLQTADGIPYLRPEIQLLYKGGKPAPLPKDDHDLARALPLLPRERAQWLHDCLLQQFPGGHRWAELIAAHLRAASS